MALVARGKQLDVLLSETPVLPLAGIAASLAQCHDDSIGIRPVKGIDLSVLSELNITETGYSISHQRGCLNTSFGVRHLIFLVGNKNQIDQHCNSHQQS